MNERIRELADEAAKFSAIMALPTCESGDKLFVEKFAELIVRECVDCLNPLSRNHSMVGAAQDTIKEHFGVEE